MVMKTFKTFKNSVILLAIFLLSAGFSRGILRPADATHGLPHVKSVFNIISDPDVHLGNWVQNVAWSSAISGVTNFTLGKDMDKVFIEKQVGLTEEEMGDMFSYMQSGRMPGGMYSLSTYALNSIVEEPNIPTNLALYLDDVKGNSIFNDDAYAATGYSEASDFFQASTLAVWKAVRNLSLSVLGLFLAIAALGVLFRQKLSPQAVVTIYSILPSVPLAIFFIVLSYPVVAVAMNATAPLMSLAIKLGMDIFGEIAQGAGLVGFVSSMPISSIVFVFLLANIINPFTVVLSLPIIVVVLSFLVLLLVLIVKAIFEYAKWYMTFVVLTIAFPAAAAVSILPGKQSVLITLIKKLLVNMLVFPVGILMLLVGFGFMATIATTNLGFGSGGWEYVLPFGIFVAMVKFFIGFGIAWAGFGIRGTLENALGAGGSISSAFSGGGGDDKAKRR